MKKQNLGKLHIKQYCITLILFLLILTGCEKDDLSKQSESLSIETVQMKTIEPPENEWTWGELNEVIYMNGQKIEIPLYFSKLCDGYEIRDTVYQEENSNLAAGSLYYKDDFIATIVYNELENDCEIITLWFTIGLYKPNQDCENYIFINGLTLVDSIEKAKKLLGSNYESYEDQEIITYDIDGIPNIKIIPNENKLSIFLSTRGN